MREREREITSQSVHGTQRRNELTCYTNSVEDVIPMLRKNYGYMRSEQFQAIKADVAKFIENFERNMHDKTPKQEQNT